jgi:hypothetical protein
MATKYDDRQGCRAKARGGQGKYGDGGGGEKPRQVPVFLQKYTYPKKNKMKKYKLKKMK